MPPTVLLAIPLTSPSWEPGVAGVTVFPSQGEIFDSGKQRRCLRSPGEPLLESASNQNLSAGKSPHFAPQTLPAEFSEFLL